MVVLGGSGEWDDDRLETLRGEGDPEADAVVAAHFAEEGASAPPAQLFSALARCSEPARTGRAVARYLADVPTDPAWLERDRLRRAQDWFARYGVHVFSALYGAALPTAYACGQGARVLAETARLETDARRRLNETAQFLLDVMRPGGLAPGGPGFVAARRVRLMHAAVRHLVEQRVPWDSAALGRPVNQEDLLATLLTFTEIVFEVLDRTGVHYRAGEADDYLHLWCYVGHLLGLRADLLPLDRAATAQLIDHVRRVHVRPSEAGHLLGVALLAQGASAMPPGLRTMPATTVRYLVGDAIADVLGMPPSNWTRILLDGLSAASRVTGRFEPHIWAVRRFSAFFGRAMLNVAVAAGRGGDRAAFAIPEELGRPLGVAAGPVRTGRAAPA